MKSKRNTEKSLNGIYKECINAMTHVYPNHFSLSGLDTKSKSVMELAYRRLSGQFKNPNKKVIEVIKSKMKGQ